MNQWRWRRHRHSAGHAGAAPATAPPAGRVGLARGPRGADGTTHHAGGWTADHRLLQLHSTMRHSSNESLSTPASPMGRARPACRSELSGPAR